MNWHVNTDGCIVFALIYLIGMFAGYLASIPRLGRCKAKLWSDEDGWMRCQYRNQHMQRRHFWIKKEMKSRHSCEWIEDEE